MPCNNPILAHKGTKLNPKTGKYPMVFGNQDADTSTIYTLPCGYCAACRAEKTRQWKVRLVHESEMHSENDFITLTYNEANLPRGGTLIKKHMVDFLKRTRKRYGEGIKFYGCGQYGSLNGRPHYHICLFGKQFKRTELVRWHPNHNRHIYRSAELDTPRPGHTEQALWPYGFSSVGALTAGSAAYVASYVQHRSPLHYRTDIYGPHITKQPEFALMSRGGRTGKGLGRSWLEKYWTDVYPKDQCMVGNRMERPPKYYDHIISQDHEDLFLGVQDSRRRYALEHPRTPAQRRRSEEFLTVSNDQKRAAKEDTSYGISPLHDLRPQITDIPDAVQQPERCDSNERATDTHNAGAHEQLRTLPAGLCAISDSDLQPRHRKNYTLRAYDPRDRTRSNQTIGGLI